MLFRIEGPIPYRLFKKASNLHAKTAAVRIICTASVRTTLRHCPARIHARLESKTDNRGAFRR